MTVLNIDLPEKYRRYGEFLPKFETLVQETLDKRVAGNCNLEMIVGNPIDPESFQTLVESGLIIRDGLVTLEEYPFDTVVLEDYPIDVLGVLTNIDDFLASKLKDKDDVDTYILAYEETHAILLEVYDFVEWLQRSNFFPKNPSLVITVNENDKVQVFEK